MSRKQRPSIPRCRPSSDRRANTSIQVFHSIAAGVAIACGACSHSLKNFPLSYTLAFMKKIALLFLGIICLSCARSEEDIQQEFDEVIAASNDCSDASECTLVYPGCPLGCFVAVNTSKETEVEEKAAELIKSYESGGRACAYDCIAPGPLECVSGKCAVGDVM